MVKTTNSKTIIFQNIFKVIKIQIKLRNIFIILFD